MEEPDKAVKIEKNDMQAASAGSALYPYLGK